jgi:hypothetical protein
MPQRTQARVRGSQTAFQHGQGAQMQGLRFARAAAPRRNLGCEQQHFRMDHTIAARVAFNLIQRRANFGLGRRAIVSQSQPDQREPVRAAGVLGAASGAALRTANVR